MVARKRAGKRKKRSRAEKNHAILKAQVNEPVWDPSVDANTQLGNLLNWYSYNKNWDDSTLYFIQYFKSVGKPAEEIRLIDKLPRYSIPVSMGWLARIITLSPDEKYPTGYFERLSDTYVDVLREAKKCSHEKKSNRRKKTKKKSNVQQAIKEQANMFMGEIEGWLDEFMENNYKSDISPLQWMKENDVKYPQAKMIADNYRSGILEELKLVKAKKDEQLNEAYDYLKIRQLNRYIKFVQLIVDDAEQWYDISKKISRANRKPRTRKPKPPIKQIAKLKYQREYENLKSINPIKIVGATRLVVYNTKYRILGVYICSNNHGFQVKGCTLQNFDEEKSFAKKIRKPVEVFPKVMDSGRIALRNLMNDIRAKERRLTGRINGDTILLRVL